jgi:hypothetical protein
LRRVRIERRREFLAMRLYELAYCCHVYVRLGGYDYATVELREATGAAVDPGNEEHAAHLFTWLRRWGCRQFATNDEQIARESLANWWLAWRRRLPHVGRTLDEIDHHELDRIASAYEELRGRQASWQRRKTGRVKRTFGPAGAAKTLYAIRPNACSPWDEPIRRRFGLPETGDGYRRHLVRIQTELTEAVCDLEPGGSAAQLPALLDRTESSPAKLVDEHDWARYTRGFEPPPPELLARWAAWATGGK